jgi:hypothetical protein
MKNILMLIINLVNWFYYSFFSFCGILWYGNLPKVSMYHRVTRQSLYKIKDIYNDKTAQAINSEDVSQRVKEIIIREYIDRLYKDDAFLENVASVNIPIFDGKEIIGNGNISEVLLRNV